MTTAMLKWSAHLLLAGALVGAATAAPNQQQAAFSVAVTLHTAVKPLSAAQLCEGGRTLQALGATIQVDCTSMSSSGKERNTAPPAEPRSIPPSPRPEVTVTF
jgi:hypothetical protein